MTNLPTGKPGEREVETQPWHAHGRGFTLIEILAATAMVAVLIASLYVSLNVGFKARRGALSAVESVRKINQTFDLIRADLMSAVPPTPVPQGAAATPLLLEGPFEGTSGQGMSGAGSDDLVFCATAGDIAPGASVSDIKQIEYTCDVTTDTKDTILARFVTTNLLAPTPLTPREEVICRGVKTFMLRYYDGTSWQDGWDSTTQTNYLPVAVEVTIELQPGPGQQVGPSRTEVVVIPCGQPAAPATTTGGLP